MISHIVLMKPHPRATAAAFEQMFAALLSLRELIPGIVDIRFGPNVSPESLDQGFSQCFMVTFTDIAARDRYLPHPAHLAVVPIVQSVAADLVVFDLETAGP